MKITKIAEQVNDKNRVSIYIDGAYAVSLTVAQVLETKLRVGDDIDEQRMGQLHELSKDGKLQQRAMEWLLLRPRSAHELSIYLRSKKLGADKIEQLLAQFQTIDLQDDVQFARWWVEQRRHKQRSANYIRQELRSKGVEQAIINEVLSECEISDNNTLRQLISKKRRNIRYKDDKKLINYLISQGYNYSDIIEALSDYRQSDD